MQSMGHRKRPVVLLGGGSRSASGSRSYDYTGMDEAAKVSQALQAAEGSFISVALSDPMRVPELQNSIRSMQQYLAAYNSGNGLPPVRVSSESGSASVSPKTESSSFGRKKMGDLVLPGEGKEGEPVDGNDINMIMPEPIKDKKPAGVAQADQGGEDNQQMIFDAQHGIPNNVDINHVPDTLTDPGLLQRKPKEPVQGPPLPGLRHQASKWDLEYYA